MDKKSKSFYISSSIIKSGNAPGAKRNMRRGTGVWCAVGVLAVVVSAFNGMARGKYGI